MNDEPQKDIHTQLYEIAHSYVMVFNPTTEDYIVEYSKAGIHKYGKGGGLGITGDPYKQWLIPSMNKDLGYGNGKVEVPFHIGQRYYMEMSDKIINEESDKQALKPRKRWKRDPSEWGVWW